jgi:serine protease
MKKLLIIASLFLLAACDKSPDTPSPPPPPPPPPPPAGTAIGVWNGPTGETLIIQDTGQVWSHTDGGSTVRSGTVTADAGSVSGSGRETSFGQNGQVVIGGSYVSRATMQTLITYPSTAPLPTNVVDSAVLASGPGHVPTTEMSDRLIVKYKSGRSTIQSDTVRKHVLTINNASRFGVNMRVHRESANNSVIMKVDRQLSIQQLLELGQALQATDPDIEWIEPDRKAYPTLTPNDTQLPNMWSLVDPAFGINPQRAWNKTTGRGVVVAVIDTGYRPHADLAANLVPGFDFIGDVVTAIDGNGRDGDALDPGDWNAAGQCGVGSGASASSWHGTHVAGTIAAIGNNNAGVVGVAFNARVQSLRVLGKCGGWISDITDAMVWGVGGSIPGVPANPTPARVLNLSLGGKFDCSSSPSYNSAINFARNNGAVVIVAAGNENANTANYSPAGCPGVVAVAATDWTGAKASFSNYGVNVSLAAPGALILSTLNTGVTSPVTDMYQYYSGTSMAAPHVAGVAALIVSRNPSITVPELEATLRASTRPFVAGCSGCGTGMLDANRAVQLGGVGSTWTFSTVSDTAYVLADGTYGGFTSDSSAVTVTVASNNFSGTTTPNGGIACQFTGNSTPAGGYASVVVAFNSTCAAEFANQQLNAVLFNTPAGNQVLLVRGVAGTVLSIVLAKQ